jgi:hypothetical protein
MPSASQTASKTGLGIDRASNTIRLTRNFDAPRAEIFAAWTKPEHVACCGTRQASGWPSARSTSRSAARSNS